MQIFKAVDQMLVRKLQNLRRELAGKAIEDGRMIL